MKTQAPRTKNEYIRKDLEESILSGSLRPGHQLPPEQAIAEQYNVSLMTARRAVSDLVSADLLERRGRVGTFVKHRLPSIAATHTVNLITTMYEGASQVALLNHGSSLARERGWNANIIRLASGQQDAAVRAIRSGEMAILSLDEVNPNSALWSAIQAAKDRVVALGPDLSADGVRTVRAEKATMLRAAVDVLRGAGHVKIVIVSQDPVPEYDGAPEAAWRREVRQAVAVLGLDMPIVDVKAPMFTSPTRKAFSAVRDFLAEDADTTALICSGDEIALGSLAACRDLGRDCPGRTSVVSIGDSSVMEFCVPSVTCIDEQIHSQVKLAMDILSGSCPPQYRGVVNISVPAVVHSRESVNEARTPIEPALVL